jgi:hypothetical protein
MRRWIVLLCLCCAGFTAAHAHLMPAQRGTLNFVGDGGFMVLSAPVSALSGTDEDGDGALSSGELQAHRATILAAIQANIRLVSEQGSQPLQGLMVSLSPPDDSPTAPASYVMVMGRFALAREDSAMRLELGLFGRSEAEQTYQVTLTRGAQKQVAVFTPDRPSRAVFPSAWAVLLDYTVLGAEHIVTGLDHILFLLVVLAAGLGARQVVMALTCFTLGHAVTLAASAWGGWSLSPFIVEPAIAATIVGMAAFDLYARRQSQRAQPWGRLALVFGCALIHGLGLASALTELGLDTANRLPSLLGFNLGIELAQLAVALLVMAVLHGVRRLVKASAQATATGVATRMASLGAIVVGSVWFVERVAGLA